MSNNFKFKKIFKYFFLSLLSFLIIFCIIYYKTVAYAITQGYGQVRLLCKSVHISSVLKDTAIPDSVKRKILLIQTIRKFAIDSIGLKNSKSYYSYYDQKGKPILWLVTASEPFHIRAFEWEFPIVGNFAYKGYFKHENAIKEENRLKQLGFDTEIDEVAAWSTLGILGDPILSSMLRRSEGSLANLIIHELTHSTIYIKNNNTFNENLASFIGEKGAIYFLENKYGKKTPQVIEYMNSLIDYQLYTQHLIRGTHQLNSFYDSISNFDKIKKTELKTQFIQRIVQSIDTISFQSASFKKRKAFKNLPNNAFFSGYLTYRKQQTDLDSIFIHPCKSNLPSFLQYIIKKYNN